MDLVIETGGKVIAVEIKATAKPGGSDFAGLAAFRKEEKCDRAYLVCQVERPQRFEHATAIPWWQLVLLCRTWYKPVSLKSDSLYI